MKRALVVSSLTLLCLAPFPALGGAQDVTVRSYLSPQGSVAVGRSFTVNVEISGAQSLRQEPVPPDLDPWAQYVGSSSRSSMRVVNGRSSVSLTIEFRYQALTEGAHRVPPIEVGVGNRTLETDALQVTVTDAPEGAPSGAGQQGDPDASGIAPEDLFVTAEATRTDVREGQPFVVEYRIWTRVDVTSYNLTRLPELEGFWVEELTEDGQPAIEQLSRGGRTYTTAVARRVALVPTGPGERTIDPLGVEAQVRVQRAFDGLFGRSSLFGSSLVPTTVLSNPIELDVEPLPPGRPEPFSGVVGTLDVSASLDRDSVATNEAVTVTVTVRGEGNIRAVPEPELGLPADFEIFPPEVTESVRPSGPGLAGEKSFEYVLIPRAPGRRQIGPISMGFFDTGADAYGTAETEPLMLTVSGTRVDGPPILARGGVEQLREDIRYIHLGTASLQRGEDVLFSSPFFWLLALLPLAAVAGSVVVRRRRDLLEGDVAYARGRRAGKVARKRLAEARGLAGEDDPRAFYAEVERALKGLVADRLNLAEAGLRTGEIEVALRERDVPDDVVRELLACLAECDRHRFAPAGAASAERDRFLQRAAELMGDLDKAIR